MLGTNRDEYAQEMTTTKLYIKGMQNDSSRRHEDCKRQALYEVASAQVVGPWERENAAAVVVVCSPNPL